MIRAELGELSSSVIFVFWVVGILVTWALGMKNSDGQKSQGNVPRSGRTNGFIPSSFRTLSGYLKIVQSSASTVARSAVSVASSIVDRNDDSSRDQVLWSGFDKLEGDLIRRVLLLGYRSGFQVWDVEEADNVCDLVSRHDFPVSFMQMLPKPVTSKRSKDKFADSRPLLVVCVDVSFSGGGNVQDGLGATCDGSILNGHDSVNGSIRPTVVRFYSLKSHSYVHVLRFRSVIYSVRCSSRVVAVSLASQIHCFDATTLEREYTILTNPVVTSCPGSGGIGYGPLAVGPRWLAYSGSPVVVSNSGRVSPQHLTPSASFPGFSSNGSLVAHYAKESSKQLAAGIVSLGDMGYKKLSRYCSELLPDGSNSPQSGRPLQRGQGHANGCMPDVDSVGMVILRDIVNKTVIAQFKAHKSPISALCFDPSGILLVSASVQGHNINVFKIMPGVCGSSSASDGGTSYVHLYRLQRGFTNAVIQDISFSDDSSWIMISSSRGTSHLFAISPSGGTIDFHSTDELIPKSSGEGVAAKTSVRWPSNSGFKMPNQQSLCASGPPITLSVVSRIRNGNNGWRGTVTGAAAAATGRFSFPSGAIASAFHKCKGNDLHMGSTLVKAKYHLLVFSPSGWMIQYAMKVSNGPEAPAVVSGLSNVYDSTPECDGRLVVEAIQKWNICQKQRRREREDNVDIYGENGSSESNKIFPEGTKEGNWSSVEARGPVGQLNVSPEEKYHLYISEVELQMHQALVPLWAKREIYFHSLVMEGIKMDGDGDLGGEMEIERIPARAIEARSKDLVPLSDYLQIPRSQQSRGPASDGSCNGHLVYLRTGLCQSGRLSCRSSSGSLDSTTDGGFSVAEIHNRIQRTGSYAPGAGEDIKGIVNGHDCPKTLDHLENVNNRENSKIEGQHKFVNNDNVGHKSEKHFEDQVDEFG